MQQAEEMSYMPVHYTSKVQSVTEMSADFSCGGREHPYKYFNIMDPGSEMHFYGSTE